MELGDSLTVIMMVVTRVAIAGMVILYKMTAATEMNMNLRILIAHRMAVAAISMASLPFVFGRKSRPKITWVVIFQAFLCGLFGMEKLGLKRMSGKLKLLATLFGIAGAMVFKFYEGPNIHVPSTHINLLDHNHQHGHVARLPEDSKSQALGTLFGVCLSFASWLI